MYSPMTETIGELNSDLNTGKNTCGTPLSSQKQDDLVLILSINIPSLNSFLPLYIFISANLIWLSFSQKNKTGFSLCIHTNFWNAA